MVRPGRRPANDTTPEALFQHCEEVYRMMLSEAKVKVVEDGEMIVWEGQLTHLIISRCNLSTPYYTHVTRKLKAMECIRMLKRGGGTAPSLWELMREPTIEVYTSVADKKSRETGPLAQMKQQLSDLDTRIKRLEGVLDKIIEEEADNE